MIVLHSKLNITSALMKTPGGGQAVNKNGGGQIYSVSYPKIRNGAGIQMVKK